MIGRKGWYELQKFQNVKLLSPNSGEKFVLRKLQLTLNDMIGKTFQSWTSNFCTFFQIKIYYQSHDIKARVCKSYETPYDLSLCLDLGMAEQT